MTWSGATETQARCRRQAAACRQHGGCGERDLDQHHRRSRTDHRLEGSGLRPGARAFYYVR